MIRQYDVKGMVCDGCAANVKKALEAVPGVAGVEVLREEAKVAVDTEKPLDTAVLQEAVKQYGNYVLSDRDQ